MKLTRIKEAIMGVVELDADMMNYCFETNDEINVGNAND
jgi:hypothetical protein